MICKAYQRLGANFKHLAISAAVCATITGTANAEPAAYEFNKTHTTIRASWDHWGYSRQALEFTDFDGQLMLDFENPTASNINVTINLADMAYWAGAPDNERFEKHLASIDLFDIAAFPTAQFVATSFESDDGVTGIMSGSLTIKDQTHPVILNVRLNKRGEVRDRARVGFSAQAVIERSTWGLGFDVPRVSDQVQITIETELVETIAE